MVKRLFPQNALLSRALLGLVGFLLLTGLASGLMSWEGHRLAQIEEDEEIVARASWQFGPGSPQVEATIRHMGEQAYPKELLAVLDPKTDKAVTAWPADFVGKTPEAMHLACGVRLPTLEQLCLLDKVTLRFPDLNQLGGISNQRQDRVVVSLLPLVPWKDERLVGLERHFALPPQGSGPFSQAALTPSVRSPDQPIGVQVRQAAVLPPAYLLVVAAKHVITPLSAAARVISALAAFCFLVYWLSVATWVFRDIQKRGGSAFAWGTLVLFTNLVGATIYLLARRQHPLCRGCGSGLEPGHLHCHACGKPVFEPCPACGHPLQNEWNFCVNCGAERT